MLEQEGGFEKLHWILEQKDIPVTVAHYALDTIAVCGEWQHTTDKERVSEADSDLSSEGSHYYF